MKTTFEEVRQKVLCQHFSKPALVEGFCLQMKGWREERNYLKIFCSRGRHYTESKKKKNVSTSPKKKSSNVSTSPKRNCPRMWAKKKKDWHSQVQSVEHSQNKCRVGRQMPFLLKCLLEFWCPKMVFASQVAWLPRPHKPHEKKDWSRCRTICRHGRRGERADNLVFLLHWPMMRTRQVPRPLCNVH